MNVKRRSGAAALIMAVIMAFAMMPMAADTAYAEAVIDDNGIFRCWIEPSDHTAAILGWADGYTEAEEEELEIPSSIEYDSQTYAVTLIDGYAFKNKKSLTKLTVSEGITEIGTDAFIDCSNLKKISLPDSLRVVGASAFSGCLSLGEISLQQSLSVIGRNAFLDTAYYKNSDNWKNVDYEEFDENGELVEEWKGSALYIGEYLIRAEIRAENGSVKFPVKNGTKLIADGAFDSSSDITKVLIPASVETIGADAFNMCFDLSQVIFEENSSLETIESHAFCECKSLESIEIPDTVTRIGSAAFYGAGLKSIVLPEGLSELEFGLLSNCGSLTEVTIPSTVTVILDNAFSGCGALTTIHFGGSPSQWAAITGNGKPADDLVKDYGMSDDPPQVSTGNVQVAEQNNYTEAAKATFKIIPKGTSLKSLKKARRAVTVKWKKQTSKIAKSHITGYQIQLATNKKFTKNRKTVTVKGYKKTSKKVTKLKGGRKYYVRIRTYKTVDGKKYYSKWSGAKTVKTKK